jgi:hypothetical protein
MIHTVTYDETSSATGDGGLMGELLPSPKKLGGYSDGGGGGGGGGEDIKNEKKKMYGKKSK